MRVERSDRTRIALASVVTLVALPLTINENRRQDREPTVAVVAPDSGLAAQLQPAPAPTVAPTAVVTTPAPAPTFSTGTEGDAIWDRWSPGSVPSGAPCVTDVAGVGAQITVTNLDTGRRATCTVVERAALPAGVIVKLDAPVFQSLADLGESPIPVRVTV